MLCAPVLFRGAVVKLPVIDRHDIRFTPVLADGESLSGGVVSITQDKYGFLWLAGHGLYRHDGYSFKPYRHEPGDPDSLADETVRVVFRDRTGILWIGTNSGGLDRLDPAQDTFVHYRHDPGNERSLSNNWVTRIYEDRGGRLWIGTNGGLDRLDAATGSFVHYLHDPQDAGSLSSSAILTLFEDRAGDLWVGTASGLNRLDRGTGHFSFSARSGGPAERGSQLRVLYPGRPRGCAVGRRRKLAEFIRPWHRDIHALLLSLGRAGQPERRGRYQYL